MADVHVLPGVARADLCPAIEIGTLLDSVRDAGLTDVAVVGRGINGEVVVWSSMSDADMTIGVLTRGLTWLANSKIVTRDEDVE